MFIFLGEHSAENWPVSRSVIKLIFSVGHIFENLAKRNENEIKNHRQTFI